MYKFTQSLFAFLYWVLAKFWFRLQKKGLDNVRNIQGPLILVSNHKSHGDHFLIIASIPRWWHSPLIPVRAMASDKLFTNWPKKALMFFLGAYPANKGKGLDVSLVKPIEILKKGGIVGIYPEGKRIRTEGIGEFKRGIGELVKRMPGIPVLPIAIKGTESLILKIFPKLFGRVKVNFGQLFYPGLTQSSEEIAADIRKIIADLYDNA